MPPPPYANEETAGHLRGQLARPGTWAWLAASGQSVVGFALGQPGWLEMLYVVPERAGSGIGSTLLDLVKHAQPDGFSLWVFETNAPARGFYRARGLVELERTDGSANEERCPDIRMAWPGRDPVGFLRRQIDDVDADLTDVVSRRAALTREIQRHKEVRGHAGRDEAREADIAARMAERGPALTAEEWRRIVHEVITVSLDAADRARPGHQGSEFVT